MRAAPNTNEADLVLEWGDLPDGSLVELTTQLIDGRRAWHEKAQSNTGFAATRLGKASPFPPQLATSCGTPRKLDTEVVLRATRTKGETHAELRGLSLPSDAPLAIVFRVTLPKGTQPGSYQMELVQRHKEETQGGCSYRWRVKEGVKDKR
jgi:hypothetical protein